MNSSRNKEYERDLKINSIHISLIMNFKFKLNDNVCYGMPVKDRIHENFFFGGGLFQD